MFAKTKKILSLVLAMLMVAAIFTGCKGKDDDGSNSGGNAEGSAVIKTLDDGTPLLNLFEEDNVTLKVWGPEASLTLLEKQCKDFAALYPDKTINFDIKACSESQARTQVLNDPDEAADVFSFVSDHMLKLGAQSKALQAITVPEVVDNIKNSNLSDAVAAGYCEVEDEDGNKSEVMYGYPITGDNGYCLFYDKSVLSEDDVKSLEGILAKSSTDKRLHFNFGDGFYACSILFTGGMTLDVSADKKQQVLNYDMDSIYATAKAFSDLVNNNEAVVSGDDTVLTSRIGDDIIAGVTGTWSASAIKAKLGDNFGVAKLPTIKVNGEDKQMISMHGYKLMGVNIKTKYPLTSRALATYLSGQKCQIERAEALGFGPSNLTALENDISKNDPVLVAISDQQQYSIPQLIISNGFWDPMAAFGQYIYNGEDQSETAMKAELNKLIENAQL